MKYLISDIGENIKRIRKQKGMTQTKLADLAEMKQQQLYQYEKGIREPRIETLVRIANALNVELSEIANISNSGTMLLLETCRQYAKETGTDCMELYKKLAEDMEKGNKVSLSQYGINEDKFKKAFSLVQKKDPLFQGDVFPEETEQRIKGQIIDKLDELNQNGLAKVNNYIEDIKNNKAYKK